MIDVEAQVRRAAAALAAIPGAADKALARAINRALLASRTEAVRAIGTRYAAKSGDVRRMIALTTATPDHLDAAVTARSPAASLGKFPHKPNKPGTGGPGRPVLYAEVKRGASKPVPGAFVANLPSGPRIVIRTGEVTSSGKAALRSLYTVPLAEMMGVAEVREAVEAKAEATLDQRLSHEIDRALVQR